MFVNHAYDHILPVVTKDRVAVAHIAPASPTLRGDYVLADIDIVINAMRVQGIGSVPDINLTLPFSKADASGHTLIGTYLDGTRDGRGRVKTMVEAGMGGLFDDIHLNDIVTAPNLNNIFIWSLGNWSNDRHAGYYITEDGYMPSEALAIQSIKAHNPPTCGKSPYLTYPYTYTIYYIHKVIDEYTIIAQQVAYSISSSNIKN